MLRSILILALTIATASAATRNCASPSQYDIDNAANGTPYPTCPTGAPVCTSNTGGPGPSGQWNTHVSDGDTVSVPAGEGIWPNGLSFTGNFALVGQSSHPSNWDTGTVIVNGTSGGNNMFSWTSNTTLTSYPILKGFSIYSAPINPHYTGTFICGGFDNGFRITDVRHRNGATTSVAVASNGADIGTATTINVASTLGFHTNGTAYVLVTPAGFTTPVRGTITYTGKNNSTNQLTGTAPFSHTITATTFSGSTKLVLVSGNSALPGESPTGTGIPASTLVQFVTPKRNLTAAVVTNGLATVSLPSGGGSTVSLLDVNSLVTGTGVPANTYVLSVTDSKHFTMTQNATATGTPTLTLGEYYTMNASATSSSPSSGESVVMSATGIMATGARLFENLYVNGSYYPFFFTSWSGGTMDHCMIDNPVDAAQSGVADVDRSSQPGIVTPITVTPGSGFSSSVTITVGPPTVVNWATNPMKEDYGVRFTGSLPAELSSNAVYFVRNATGSGFNIASAINAPIIACSSTGSGITATATDNNPQKGIYMYSVPYVFGAGSANLHARPIIIEDNIFRTVGLGIAHADGPGNQAGGCIDIVRHNSMWCTSSYHGFGESGGNTGRFADETYNNLFYLPKASTFNSHDHRSGAGVIFNERRVNAGTNAIASDTVNRACPIQTQNSIGPFDGTNFADLNARGGDYSFNSTECGPAPSPCPWVQYAPHEVDATNTPTLGTGATTINCTSTTGQGFPSSGTVYVNTNAGTQPFAYNSVTTNSFVCTGSCTGTGTVVANSPIVTALNISPWTVTIIGNSFSHPGGVYPPVVFQADGVSPGLPTDYRIGAVYGQGTTITQTSHTGGATVILPWLGTSSDSPNKYAGFQLTDRTRSDVESAGGQGTGIAYSDMIVSSVWVLAGGGNPAGTQVVTQVPHDGFVDYCTPAPCTLSGHNFEVRWGVQGIGFPGSLNFPFSNGGSPIFTSPKFKYYVTDSHGSNVYYASRAAGEWAWENKGGSLTGGVISAPTNINNFNGAPHMPDTRFIAGASHNAVRTVANGADADYPQISPSDPHFNDYLRVGADWDDGIFGGINSDGSTVATLPGNILASDSRWPAGWPAVNAYGQLYPSEQVCTTPTITSANSFSVSNSQGSTFQVTTCGFGGAPTFGATGLPTGATINTSTGLITINSGISAGTYPVTLSATYSPLSQSTTQPWTLNLTSPDVCPTPTITSPSNNSNFNSPATIQLTATLSGGNGTPTKVDFFYGGTNLIGTATSSPWTFSWSGMAVATYSLTARCTDAAGNTSTSSAITTNVVNNSPTPPVIHTQP